MSEIASKTAACLIAGLLLFAGGVARAQSNVAAARDQFRAGIAAAEAERWEEARSAFERSHALAPRPVTLFNLARAQVMTGQLVGGLESFRRFLREATEPQYQRYREQAEASARELDTRIPRLRLNVAELRAGDRVLLDGAEIPRASVGIPYPVDPGDHAVAVVRGEAEIGRASVHAEEGRVSDVEVELAAPAVTADPVPPVEVAPDPAPVVPILPVAPDPEPPRGDDLLGPILGTTIGVLVAAAIAIGVTVYVVEQPSPAPFQGTLGPGVITVD